MTPRKELFLKTREALSKISGLEYVDLERGQMKSDKFPNLFTAALIKIRKINWECMTNATQEGTANIDVYLYCRDGWLDQHHGTEDQGGGYNEIDLLDDIAEALQFLSGDQFKPLQLLDDEAEEESMQGLFVYRQSFSTMLYRKLNPDYFPKQLKFL